MNLPNKLTLLRIVLVPFFVAALLAQFPHHMLVALVIFSLASITDCLDGKIARKRGLITNFGKFADPLADKILVVSAFICFVQLGFASAWLAIIVIFREFAVTSIRLCASAGGKVIAANIWGKLKTVSQMTAIIAVMLMQYVFDLFTMGIFSISAESLSTLTLVFTVISSILLWVSAILTLISGIIYIVDNKEFISQR